MSGFLDTSVIVRYFTNDPVSQSRQAADLIDSDEDLYITSNVLAETAYVLMSVYRIQRPQVVDHLVALLSRANIKPIGMDKPEILKALPMCRPSKRVSFYDAILWAAARSSPHNTVYSFDQLFPREGLEVKVPS
jgi:predicted nucleic-acid-binding protein